MIPSAATVLHQERHAMVAQALLGANARSVLDLGCGDGSLLAALARSRLFTKLAGIDRSMEALGAAERRLRDEPAFAPGSWELYQASFEAPDRRLAGYDAVLLVEAIEHVDPRRLSAVEHTVFGCYRPGTIVITTPNREYNPLFGMREDALRHPDHRFEWTRAKFRSWASGAAARNRYGVTLRGIGPADLLRGSPTQMAVFAHQA